jgi:hypothetical protein
MELTLLKNWATFKKGERVIIKDESVIKKGLEIGLFEKGKKENKKE